MKILIAMTGASGVIYGIRLLQAASDASDVETHLIMSDWACENIRIETDYSPEQVRAMADFSYDNADMAAAVSSGSFSIDAMAVVPCSVKTLSAIANGYAHDLISRAADVSIKEQRKLILSVRESPLSPIHLENMLKLSRIGVRIMPAVPSFYDRPETIDDIVNQYTGRLLDSMGIDSDLLHRWTGAEPDAG